MRSAIGRTACEKTARHGYALQRWHWPQRFQVDADYGKDGVIAEYTMRAAPHG